MWVLYAVLNPLAEASRGVFSKKASISVDPLIVSWSNNLIPVILYSPVLFLVDLRFNFDFAIALSVSGVINILTTILYHRAIKEGDISLVIPMTSFTPLFLLIFSPIIVGEFPSAAGFAGVIFIVSGSYMLNINFRQESIFDPIRALFRNKGTRYMLIVALLWSISTNFDKIGIQSSSIYQYIFFLNAFVFAGITIFVSSKKKLYVKNIKPAWEYLFLVGFFTSLTFFFHMNAIALTLVAYVVAIKRTSGMISVLFGYLFLQEPGIRYRLPGSVIMFIGVLLIILF